MTKNIFQQKNGSKSRTPRPYTHHAKGYFNLKVECYYLLIYANILSQLNKIFQQKGVQTPGFAPAPIIPRRKNSVLPLFAINAF